MSKVEVEASEPNDEDVLQNLESLATLYQQKYETVLDQNRRIRDQSTLPLAANIAAFSLLGPAIKTGSAAVLICFIPAIVVFVGQSLVALSLLWPYASQSFLHDDWDDDWRMFVSVNRRQHLTSLTETFLVCIEAEKKVLPIRSRQYWWLLASSVCCPLLLLLAYLVS